MMQAKLTEPAKIPKVVLIVLRKTDFSIGEEEVIKWTNID
jgi:hypothetical protein